jgi:crotonobetainyl-CoA:carnitine CoA-transferase CaiB-like acyl-CoA transferase
MSSDLSQPLSGIRVLDLTSVLFGPYATQILGDFGADVIKIEAPAGDPTRGIGPRRNDGMAAAFLGCNRNKKSVQLDLKRPAARDALWRLIETADVFVHNIRPQKVAALGFGPDPVTTRNPKIVYGALHGYLEEGPYAGRPAYDDVIQAESGIAGAFLARDGKPAFAPSVIADKSAALIATTGLLAAMFQRLRTGKGVYMEIGMFESMAAYTLMEHQYGQSYSPPLGDAGYPRVISRERKPYATQDGYICMLAYTDKQWRSFWELTGKRELIDDPRFQSLATRTKHIDVLYAYAGELVATQTSAYWLEVLSKAEIPCGKINTFDDLRSDPHLRQTELFRRYTHPSEGELDILDSGLRLNGEKLPIRQHQPKLGEHSESVLRDAGLSPAEIAAALST